MKTLARMKSTALSSANSTELEPIVYLGIGRETGKVVPATEALDYALQQCGLAFLPHAEKAPDHAEFCEMLVDWYFSGDWIRHTLP